MPADVALAAPDETAQVLAQPSPLAAFASAFRENRGAMIGLAVLAVVVLAAVFADFLAPHAPGEQFRDLLRAKPIWAGGSWRFVLGTDGDGRDMLSRVIFGARISLFIGVSVMAFAFVIGVALGLLAAMAGSVVDVVVTRLMDVIMATPSLVLAVVIVAILGPSLTNTIVAVTIVGLPRYVRVARASALGELPKDYVTAARVAGVGPLRLALTAVLPNCLAPLIVQAALGVSDAILEAAGLGFLGLGAQPPTPEWGVMLADAREFIRSDPWIVTLPGLAILVTVVAINLTGDGLRDALDPKMRERLMQVIVLAIPVFLLAIAAEYAASVALGRKVYRVNDAINSLSIGILSQISGVFTKLLTIGIYAALFSHVALWRLPADNPLVWAFALIGYDFLYYWNHRLGHVCGVFWAAHVVHHQSEDYNLTTALRQTSSGALLSWLFYVPLAVAGVPPVVFAVVGLVDLLYQFWIHTELVGKLGWFDRVFASPSNHRVHHAVNRAYLDRNYGGIFIVWDRLFGTFVEEGEPCVYGTRPRLASFDPVWANFEIYWELARRSYLTRDWGDKLRVWVSKPGWLPDDLKSETRPWPRGVRRYDPSAGVGANVVAALALAGCIAATAAFLWSAEESNLGPALVGAGAITAALWAAGALIQSRLSTAEALFLFAAAGACAASAYGAASLFAVLKPAATALALAAFALRAAPLTPKALLLAGLAASLAGDTLLLRDDGFLFGLAAFLIAHLFYIALLARDARPRRLWGLTAGAALYGVAMLAYLWPHLDGGLKAPVAAYVVVIMTMLALALNRAGTLRTPAATLVGLGALLFAASDSALALTLFAGGGEALRLLVLPTYWGAQALISFHVLARATAPAPLGAGS